MATWCEELTHWKRAWYWEILKVGGEGDDRGWDGWVAPPTQCTWVSVSSGSWWWTGKLGMQQWMGSQSIGHNWATELNWNSLIILLWRCWSWKCYESCLEVYSHTGDLRLDFPLSPSGLLTHPHPSNIKYYLCSYETILTKKV